MQWTAWKTLYSMSRWQTEFSFHTMTLWLIHCMCTVLLYWAVRYFLYLSNIFWVPHLPSPISISWVWSLLTATPLLAATWQLRATAAPARTLDTQPSIPSGVDISEICHSRVSNINIHSEHNTGHSSTLLSTLVLFQIFALQILSLFFISFHINTWFQVILQIPPV